MRTGKPISPPDATPHWALRYIGAGFRSGACGPDHFDCWGLVRHHYRVLYDIEIDPVNCNADSLRHVRRKFAAHCLYEQWHKVKGRAVDGDAVLMRQGRFTSHVGLFADMDGGRIIHALPGVGVVAQKPALVEQTGYEIAHIYRHVERTTASGADMCSGQKPF